MMSCLRKLFRLLVKPVANLVGGTVVERAYTERPVDVVTCLFDDIYAWVCNNLLFLRWQYCHAFDEKIPCLVR